MFHSDVDVSELKVFRNTLEDFHRHLSSDVQILVVQGYGKLGEVWQDVQFRKFSDRFEESLSDLYAFSDYMKEYIEELNRDISRLEEYLSL